MPKENNAGAAALTAIEESSAQALMDVDPGSPEAVEQFLNTAEGLDGSDPAPATQKEDADESGTGAEAEEKKTGSESEDGAEGKAKPDADDEKAEKDEDVPKSIRDLPDAVRAEVQEVLDKRIGKEVAKRKTLETQLDMAQSDLARLQEQTDQLRQQAEEANSAAVSTEINPLLLTSEDKIDALDKHYAKLEAFAFKHLDGYTDEESGTSYTGEQIRERYQQIREMRQSLIPQARQVAQLRKKYEQAARELHPDLFDPKKPEYKAAQQYLKAFPQLRVLPNVHVVIGDAIVGERIRTEAEKKKGDGSASAVPAATPPPKKAPAPPASSSPGPSSPRAAAPAAKSMDMSKVVETGGNDPDAVAGFLSAAGL